MPREEKDNVVPSYGYVVDNTVDFTPPKADPPAPATPPAPPAPETVPGEAAAKPGEGDAPAATPGEGDAPAAKPGEAAPAESGTKADPNNELLSGIAQTLQQITQRLDQAPPGTEQQTQAQEDPMIALDRQLADIQAQAAEGKITYDEMLAQSAPVIREQARLEARKEVEAEKQQGQVQAAQGQFLQQYPEFQAFVGSPEAQAFVQANPVFDHVSAFFASREQKALQEKQALESQVTQLQEQIQKSIKNAATEQSAIVGEGGNDVGVPTTYRGDGVSAQQGGMNALQRARQQL